ncbi:hypothetical protein U879_07445 [Defluviimonas sp. 20V17]|nr:hypothetical protein U879_07445 [Defluviimonas sp. 20V17]
MSPGAHRKHQGAFPRASLWRWARAGAKVARPSQPDAGMLRLILLCSLAAGLAGCTGFPKLDAAVGPEARQAAYPRLAPLGQILTCPTKPAAAAKAPGADLAARGAALRAKARKLYNAPIPGG